MDDLGDFYEAQGEKEKARGLYEQALVVHQRTLGPDIYTSIPFLNRGAKTHMALGHYAEAEILFKRILGICKQVFGTGHPQVAIALADLASAEERIPKESHKAAADLKESLAILRKSLGDNHPLSAQVQERLAKLSTR
jgi:tetratricopeptide (TPR) repeat protein